MAGRKIARRTFPSGAPIWTDTNTRGGWLLGGGIEYGFKPNWTVKLEYNYLKLGDWTAPTIPAEWHRDVQMIKMGMNYKFESGNSDEAARTPDDSTGSARAKGRQAGTEDLAKASQNPIASLTTLPFQNNSNFNNGPFGRTQNVLNIEPVVPMSLNAQWNVISRTIIPCTLEPPAESGCYVYEVGCDAGSGDRVGCFQSRVVGVGPQVGFIIPVSATTQAYLNFKGYREFDNATDRMAGMPG